MQDWQGFLAYTDPLARHPGTAMKHRSLLLLFVATTLAGSIVIRAQQPAFRSAIDVVSMSVTVTDSSSKYITDLTEKDFEIFEDGVKQDLTLFNRSNLPVALSLLIDTSSSMEDRMATAQDAAIGFVRKLRPTDLGEVIGFDSRAEVLQKFTGNTAELEQAIRKTVAGGSTSLNNALYIALKGLKKIPVQQEDEIRRQAIILLSDGEDTSSLVTFDDVLDLARRSETAIYAIGLMEDTGGGQSKGFREATYALRQLTNDTGGRAFFPADVRSLANVYGQIYDELSSQYTIGYTSKNPRRDGAWRRIVVRVARPNAQARTKQGYFAPVAAAAR
jgi:Ca-activated chloride channel homolog